MLTIEVHGTPAPQGSKRAYVNRKTGRANLVESSAKVKPWRAAIVAACHAAKVTAEPGPVRMVITFWMPRPRSHFRAGRHADLIRNTAPQWPAVKPDLDKLIRSTLDGLTDGGALHDDSRVVHITASKRYTVTAGPGATITIHHIQGDE